MRFFHDYFACFSEHADLQKATSERQVNRAANQDERHAPWLIQNVADCKNNTINSAHKK